MATGATTTLRRTAPRSAREIWVRLLLYPGHTLPTALAPVLVGCGLAWRDGVFAPGLALLGFLGSWLIHLGGVFADNYELLTRHAALREHPELSEAVENGTLRLTTLRRLTIGCFAAGIACGPWLAWIGGPLVVAIGILGVVASLGYASGGIRYTRFGLAEPVFLLLFGVVAEIGIYGVQAAAAAGEGVHRLLAAGALPPEIFLAGLPVGALVTNVLIIDDLRDREPDRSKGWSTAATRWGLLGGRIEYSMLSLVAYLAPIGATVAGDQGARALLPLLTLPLALPLLRAVWTRSTTAELLATTPRASRLALLYAALLGLSLATG